MQNIETATVSAAKSPADGGDAALSIALDADLASRLSAFVCRNTEFATHDEAARHILRRWLAENGFDGTHEDTGIRPDALNASNDD